MAETKDPEIHDIDLTHKLLEIAHRSQADPSLRATHAAARAKLAKLNAAIQEEVDKGRKAEAEAAAKKAAEDEAAAKEAIAKKAADDAKKAAEDAKKTQGGGRSGGVAAA